MKPASRHDAESALKQALMAGMKLRSGPPELLPRSKMKAMKASAEVESSALRVKNVRDARGTITASGLIGGWCSTARGASRLPALAPRFSRGGRYFSVESCCRKASITSKSAASHLGQGGASCVPSE